MKKKYTILILTLLISFAGYAQDLSIQNNPIGLCGTEPVGPIKRYTNTELSSARHTSNNVKYVFNVKAHFIANIVPESEQELKALDLVGALNLYFNSANIFFKYKGYNNINDSSFLDISGNNITTLSNSYGNSNQIDVFICEKINSNVNTAGTTYTWTNSSTGEISKKVIALRYDFLPIFNSLNPTRSDFKYYTSVHEMGHYLGLYHPHQRWKYNASNELIPVRDNVTDCEALEENLDNSQWDILGDFIQDTNPDRVQKQYGLNYYTNNCSIFWGNYQDNSCGNSINQTLFNPSTDNIMAYYHSCRSGFSSNQYDFMRAFIADESDGGFLTSKLNTVESLYQPFEIINVEGDVAYVTDNVAGDGMATVCRGILRRHRFQKGFDYSFSGTTKPDPSSTKKNEIPLIENNTYAFDVTIHQIDNNKKETIEVICTRDLVCKEEAYTGGKKTTTSNLGGGEVTVKILSSQEVSDPDLIKNLEPQKYHIIKKTTESGATFQKTIYKNE